jgi:hypothetical protein
MWCLRRRLSVRRNRSGQLTNNGFFRHNQGGLDTFRVRLFDNETKTAVTMRYFFFILWAALTLCSCFETRFDDTEAKRLQRIRDSIHADSVEYSRSIPDTTLAIYKRTAFCDTIDVIVFDRVKMLSGDEAAEYAQRHNRFGNTTKIIVNQEELLETLVVARDAKIWLLDDGTKRDSTETMIEINPRDTIRFRSCKPAHLSDDMPKEELVFLIIQHRSIIYFKQLQKDDLN